MTVAPKYIWVHWLGTPDPAYMNDAIVQWRTNTTERDGWYAVCDLSNICNDNYRHYQTTPVSTNVYAWRRVPLVPL